LLRDASSKFQVPGDALSEVEVFQVPSCLRLLPSIHYPSTRFAAQEPRCSGTTRSGQRSGQRSGTDGMRVVPSLSCSILVIGYWLLVVFLLRVAIANR